GGFLGGGWGFFDSIGGGLGGVWKKGRQRESAREREREGETERERERERERVERKRERERERERGQPEARYTLRCQVITECFFIILTDEGPNLLTPPTHTPQALWKISITISSSHLSLLLSLPLSLSLSLSLLSLPLCS